MNKSRKVLIRHIIKSLVGYSSQTGNTRKLAEVVYNALSGEKEIYPVAEAPDPDKYDVIAVGFWLMAGKPDANTLEYFAKIKDNPLLSFNIDSARTKTVFFANICVR